MRSALLLLALASPLAAQSLVNVNRAVDFAFANGDGATTLSAGITRISGVGKLTRIRAGVGLRGTLGTGTIGLTPQGATLVPPTVKDTLRMSLAPISVNIAAHIGVLVTETLMAGFNIDVFGFTAGGTRSGIYTENQAAAGEGVNAQAASTNVFQGGSKDRGTLNSQFFAMWAFSDRYAIKGGLSHQRFEYVTETPLASNTRRFQMFSNLLFLGVQIVK